MADPIQSTEALVLQEQMKGVKGGIDDLKTEMRTVNVTLQKLVQVEERQLEHARSIERAHKAIEDIDNRVDAIEAKLPPLISTRSWTIGTALVVCLFALWSILGTNVSIKAPMQSSKMEQTK